MGLAVIAALVRVIYKIVAPRLEQYKLRKIYEESDYLLHTTPIEKIEECGENIRLYIVRRNICFDTGFEFERVIREEHVSKLILMERRESPTILAYMEVDLDEIYHREVGFKLELKSDK